MNFKAVNFRYLLLPIALLTLSAISTQCSDGNNTDSIDNPEVVVIKPEDRLPQIFVNTNGAEIIDEPKIDGEITISKAEVVSYQGKIGIEIRGASSQSFPKKSYGFETRDPANADLDVSLFGLPEESDWILYGPYSDKSLMRNVLIYELSRDIGQYASRSSFVELTINNQYKGIYVFMEKLKRDAGRININKLKPDENSGENLTGGYILKIDKTAGNNLGEGYNEFNSFTSVHAPLNANLNQEIHFLYEDPKAEEITPEQKYYISNYVADFENALASADFKDENLGYPAFIDVSSFIDFFLLNELSHNVDGFRLSTFMTKDKNGKLKMGPIWDFNLAFGNADYCDGSNTNTWAYQFNVRCGDDFWLIPFWWNRFMEDPAFVTQLKARWNTLRGGALTESAILSKIDGYAATLEKSGAVNKNFKTWQVLGVYVWPNNFIGNTYSDEANYLKNWVKSRLNWMDSAINGL